MPRAHKPIAHSAQTLTNLGLSEAEGELYTLMLTREPSTVRQLMLLSPLPRTLLYHVLDQLIRRGLVTTKKDGWRTIYIAQDPDNLYSLLAKREQEQHQHTEAIRNVIPQLKQSYVLAGNRPTVRTFEGVDEFEKALEGILISGAKEVYAFEYLAEHKPGFESRATHERKRVQRKIQKQVVFFESTDALKVLAARGYNDYTEYRGVTGGTLKPFKTDLILFGGKVLYITSYGAHEPIAILVEDKSLYEMQKNVFDALWSAAKDRTLYYTEGK